MDEDILRYDLWIEEALRGVIRRSLRTVEDMGLPGDHHFYITFRTDHPDLDIADWLKTEYPDEMTIVLQHQFGLQLKSMDMDDEEDEDDLMPEDLGLDPSSNANNVASDDPDEESKSGEVIALDAFRKKQP